MRVVSVAMAVAVPLAAGTAGVESCWGSLERGGYHASPPEHLPGPLRGVHHAAEPPVGVSAKPEREKAEGWGEVRALESSRSHAGDVYVGDF